MLNIFQTFSLDQAITYAVDIYGFDEQDLRNTCRNSFEVLERCAPLNEFQEAFRCREYNGITTEWPLTHKLKIEKS